MLDDEEGDALLAERQHAVDDDIEERRIDAAGRLVEKKETRIGHQARGDVHQLFLSVGQFRGRQIGKVGDADKIEKLHRPSALG